MRPSRGMGCINPEKQPRTIKKRDGNEPVELYKEGGAVKKFADGGIAEKQRKEGEDIVRKMMEQYAKESPQNAAFVPKYKPPVVPKKAASPAPSTMSQQEMADMAQEFERRKQQEFEEFTAPVGKAKGGKVGLYANIHAKQRRIASGSKEKMRKPGQAGAPTAAAFKQSAKTAKKA